MPHRGSHSGFTLIEVLIALTLIALMMGLLFGSLRTGGRIWDAGTARAENTMTMQAAQQLLRRIIEECRPLRARGQDNRPIVLFDGTGSRLSFIATRPAAARGQGYYRYTLGIEDGDDGRRLILAMEPWSPATGMTSGSEAAAERVVLLDGVEGLEIGYFGEPERNSARDWYADWTAREKLPDLVRIAVTSAHRWPVLLAVTRIDGDMPVVAEGGGADAP